MNINEVLNNLNLSKKEYFYKDGQKIRSTHDIVKSLLEEYIQIGENMCYAYSKYNTISKLSDADIFKEIKYRNSIDIPYIIAFGVIFNDVLLNRRKQKLEKIKLRINER